MAISYHQRLYDAGTVGWVYYTKSFIDPTPSAGETTPNYTGAISAHSVIAETGFPDASGSNLIAEWNRTDLSQFVSAGAPDLAQGGGGGALSVAPVAERGNVLVYTPAGGATVTELFMFSAASGLLIPSTTERRDVLIEIELYDATWGTGGYFGAFLCGDADTPLHGFIHLMASSEGALVLNNGTVATSGGSGTPADRLAQYLIRGRKPAAAAPEVTSYMQGFSTGSGTFEPRRSGSTSGARGAVTDFGNNTTLGATWNATSCDRLGLAIRSSGGNPPPTQVRILNFRIFEV